jgi:hypothetical protein
MDRLLQRVLSILILIIPAFAFGQSKVHLTLLAGKPLTGKNYRVIEVIDARPDKSSIGSVYPAPGMEVAEVDLAGGVKDALQNFYDKALPNREAEKRLTARVSTFYIRHVTGHPDSGSVTLSVNYFLAGTATASVHSYSATLTRMTENMAAAFPELMSTALRQSLQALDSLLADTAQTTRPVALAPENLKTILVIDSTKPSNPPYYLFIVNAFASVYEAGLWAGPELSLALRLNRKSGTYLGLNGDYLLFDRPAKTPSGGYNGNMLNGWNIGATWIQSVSAAWFLRLNVTRFSGKEDLSVYVPTNAGGYFVNSARKLSGYEVNLATCFMPPEYAGLYIGAGLFYRENNSRLLGDGMGLRLGFGVKF